jgi:hypothetical protein
VATTDRQDHSVPPGVSRAVLVWIFIALGIEGLIAYGVWRLIA